MLWVKAFGVWLGMLLAAFLNGALRELLIVRLVGEQVGHVLSVVVFGHPRKAGQIAVDRVL